MTAFVEQALTEPNRREDKAEKPRSERTARGLGPASGAMARPTSDARPAVARDLTEQRSREARLFHVRRMAALGELTSSICHDFNNILTTIVGNLGEVVRDAGLGDEARDMVEDALAAAVEGAGLTRRFGAREAVARPRAVEVGECMTELARTLRRITRHRVAFVVEVADEAVATVDRGQLESAVIELCFNAQNALPEGGTIRVVVDRVGARARVRVEDDGVGMDEETLRRAPELFFTTRGATGATGLGLAMVDDFATRHGGELVLASAAGQGTCATIWLPIA